MHTAANSTLKVGFWGVRGSVPCPGPDYAEFGGNSSCVVVECGEALLIFDAGSGIRPLGNSAAFATRRSATLFFSHFHHDHIVGFPFFAPIFESGFRLDVYAARRPGIPSVHAVMNAALSSPYLPDLMPIVAPQCVFHDFAVGNDVQIGPGIAVRTHDLCHPGGATAYRVQSGSHSVAYVTDHEMATAGSDALRDFVEGCDVLIFDSMFDERIDGDKPRWGHSTVQEGVALARDAGCTQFVAFHHNPNYPDPVMREIDAWLSEQAGVKAFAAREGMSLLIE
ncbi:MAG: MBL fold metallo-hydrolase [Sinobacteraceae bacterium]|nr:MBL fold metallo-hydrolase [Nevskiaceae bacterium]